MTRFLTCVTIRLYMEPKDYVVVLVGVDRSNPSKQILKNIQNKIRSEISNNYGIEPSRLDIDTKSDQPNEEYKDALGEDIAHIQQHEVGYPANYELPDHVCEDIIRGVLEKMNFTVFSVISREISDERVIGSS